MSEDQVEGEPLSQVAARFGGGSEPGGFDDDEEDEPTLPWHAQEPATAEAAAARRHGKTFHDPVHNSFRLPPLFLDFIDTSTLQRLRYLAQLGLTTYVFPSATHTRFEHSLGVCHKAYQLGDQLWALNRKRRGGTGNMDITGRDLLVVGLAGLCHDLGHGPFSHVWDREFCQEAKGLHDWKHEEMSCRLLEYMVDTHHIDSVSAEELKLVQRLILGEAHSAPDGKMFLFDIVSNSRNSIDVDKLDYLERDAYHCGVKVGCDFGRLMHFAKVINNEICFKWSEFHSISELFHTRCTMHRRVYTHRKAKGIEYMLVDALKEADLVLKFSENMADPAHFVQLDDTLLRQIEMHPDDQGPMAKAKAIIARLRARQLYKHVNEVLVPPEKAKHFVAPSPSEICGEWHSNGQVRLDPDQVVVNMNKLNWSMKDKNPLEAVHWFSYFDDVWSYAIEPHHMTQMLTPTFQETMLRVYSKDRRPEVVRALNTAFQRYCSRVLARDGQPVYMATPRHSVALRGADAQLLREHESMQGSVLKRARANSVAAADGHINGAGPSQPHSQQQQQHRRHGVAGGVTQPGPEHGEGDDQGLPAAGHPGDHAGVLPAKRRRSLHEDMEAAVRDLGSN